MNKALNNIAIYSATHNHILDGSVKEISKELDRLEKYDEIVRNNIKVYKKHLYTNNNDIYACCLMFKGYEYTINEELYLFLKGAFE